MIASLVMVTGILWPLLVEQPPPGIPQSENEILADFMAVFGIASIGIWMHALIWLVTRRELVGPLNLAVIALNFDAWVVALWILGG
jgi:hypothetical protein